MESTMLTVGMGVLSQEYRMLLSPVKELKKQSLLLQLQDYPGISDEVKSDLGGMVLFLKQELNSPTSSWTMDVWYPLTLLLELALLLEEEQTPYRG